MREVFIILGILTTIGLAQACTVDERTKLTPEEYDIVDSIYSKSVGEMRKKSDSICDVIYQKIYDDAVDSLKQAYIREIEEILQGEG